MNAAARARTPGPLRPHPRLAAGLSLVPGLGQLCTCQPGKAFHYLLGSLLPMGASIALLVVSIGLGRGLIAGGAAVWAMLLALVAVVLFLVLFVVGLYSWASAAVDAYQSAGEIRSGAAPAPQRRYFHL